MLKVGLAAAVFAVAGTAAVVTHHASSSDRAELASVAAGAQPGAPATPAPAASPRGAAPVAKPPALAVPGAVTAPPIDEEPPRMIGKDTIARLRLDQGPSRGPANAPVTIIVFQDAMCPFCSNVLGTIDQIWEEFPDKLRLVVKQLPVHDEARLAAQAALAAEAQGKFWELHDVMLANQDDLSRDALVGYAKQAGLDAKKLAKALDDKTYEDDVATEMAAAQEIGVNATPTFLINGQEMRGALPVEMFRTAINEALAAKAGS